jgi:membrane protease YdiL (CAAX protease family)
VDRSERRESWSALPWSAIYLGWLFVCPEGELAHWLTLVALPLAALRASRGSWRAALESAGLARSRVWRGLGVAALLRRRVAGVAATAALFGLYHVPYALTVPAWGCEGDLSAAFGAALATGLPLGLVLGWLHERSGRNLLAPILAHAMVNSLPGMLWLESHLCRRG